MSSFLLISLSYLCIIVHLILTGHIGYCYIKESADCLLVLYYGPQRGSPSVVLSYYSSVTRLIRENNEAVSSRCSGRIQVTIIIIIIIIIIIYASAYY